MAYSYREQHYDQQQWYPQSSYGPRITPQHQQARPNPPNQHYIHQQVPFPAYHQQQPQVPYGYVTPPHHPAAGPSQGRNYLASLTTSFNDFSIGKSALATEKPLPRLPPVLETRPMFTTGQPQDQRPESLPSYADSIPPLPVPPAIPPRPVTQIQTPPKATAVRKSFTPSFHPHRSDSQVELLRPPDLIRPQSDSLIPSSKSKGKGKSPGRAEVWDLTLDSDEESPTILRRRAISDLPHTSPSKASGSTQGPRTPICKRSPIKPAASPLSPHAVRCSGYTRSGQPCKRVVKSTAPYLLARDINSVSESDAETQKEERYCKDHAGQICQVGGFYWKGDKKSVWVDFTEHIPFTLGQQTQALLRTTMESKLTDKDLPGFLYAYELRDLQTPRVSFYKIGRTDNVPRRMSEWSSQCRSHTPTLRDIFPRRPPKPLPSRLSHSDLHRRETGSYLPGAFHSGSNVDSSRPRVMAMKRWERLVHLELADLSSTDCPEEWKGVRSKCGDCGTIHREIFPILRTGTDDEYDRVVEVVARWAAFINKICSES